MTYQDNFTIPQEIMEQIIEHGWEYIPEMIREMINSAMQVERDNYLGVK
jgi:hypothetical protein